MSDFINIDGNIYNKNYIIKVSGVHQKVDDSYCIIINFLHPPREEIITYPAKEQAEDLFIHIQGELLDIKT